MAVSRFTWRGFLLRLLFALLLVLSTYNPSGYSYVHWLQRMWSALPSPDVLGIFCGVVLLIGWVIFTRATSRSLGIIGIGLASAFFATLTWLLVDWQWIPADNPDVLIYIALFMFAAVLAVGMSWSHVRRRLSGQADVDDVDQV